MAEIIRFPLNSDAGSHKSESKMEHFDAFLKNCVIPKKMDSAVLDRLESIASRFESLLQGGNGGDLG
ncbi:MAG: hypothetical protein RRB22_01080 [Gammaproteobacteria bacterium]|nr:hypothetical protein [Gammaproteobacteria bacterium]